MLDGWARFHRKIADWEWYTDANTFRVFFHLVLMANHEDNRWQGNEIKRGQLITSSESLQKQLKLSRQQIRTSLNKLISTNEITIKPTNKFTLVTVANYDTYQLAEKKSTNKTTNKSTIEQPTDNQQVTTNKNDKKDKNDKKEDIYIRSQSLSMTEKEYDTLVDKYGKEAVESKIEYSRNYAKLKNYTSLYLTLNKWLASEPQKIKVDMSDNDTVNAMLRGRL